MCITTYGNITSHVIIFVIWGFIKLRKPLILNPADDEMFKVNNRNTRIRFEICSKLTIMTPDQRQ